MKLKRFTPDLESLYQSKDILDIEAMVGLRNGNAKMYEVNGVQFVLITPHKFLVRDRRKIKREISNK